MKWLKWRIRRKPRNLYIKGHGTDNYSAIPVRLILPDAPIKIDHTVIHTAYPRPTTVLLRAQSRCGRQWQLEPIHVRGGSYFPIRMPPHYEGDEWDRIEMDIRYE